MDYRFERVTPDDVHLLRRVSLETFEDAYREGMEDDQYFQDYCDSAFSNDTLTQEIKNPESQFYLLVVEGKVAGYFKVNVGKAQTVDKGDQYAEIQRIYLYETYHGQRLGQLMFDQALKIARDQGKTAIWLGVWPENRQAIHFYRKQGMTKTGTVDFVMGDLIEEDDLMEMPILGDNDS
ncbi:GNAT family N-acetyltransferase [Staphylococcus sp. IVB6238]|uniref:GNAT family N-acetyltransferase n=1 Tax=unclassified Staphylococcus TaxID=91994 RepID=UPI0021CFCD16|nr:MULTISPECIES: GNAT family N-acetyltransferase [unclassified Staphylococcus]UXR71430.1 GNAT family N-acetyltransferase [Staphylococcus sp. IVB6240]UXR73708.1 GNAT family N-acetyltransferase [Staphylococcus sp. IVB6238]